MKKIAFFALIAAVLMNSCSKDIKEKLYYTLATAPDTILHTNVYIPDSGTFSMPIEARFYSGNNVDPITMSLSGLPAGITVTPDSFSQLPSYTGVFTFTTKHAARGVYPITLTTYTPTAGTQTATINLNVIPYDCASLFWGNLTGTNACSDRDYTFGATGSSSGTTNNLTVNNFGGYGTNVNVSIIFNGTTDSLYIPLNNYGNGTVLTGAGTFTTSMMIIHYSATSTPTGVSETCIDTLRFN